MHGVEGLRICALRALCGSQMPGSGSGGSGFCGWNILVPDRGSTQVARMKRLPLVSVLTFAAGCLLGGCETTGSGLVVRSTGGASGPTGYVVEEPSAEVAGQIKIVRAVPHTTEGERVAQVDLQNLTAGPLEIEYQFRWRDRFGSELISLWDWRNMTLPANRTTRIEDEAFDSEWIHYICEIRLRK